MDDLLSISSTRHFSQDTEPLLLSDIGQPDSPSPKPPKEQFESPADILQILQSKPSFESLQSCLDWLLNHDGEFDIHIPGPQATQIISTLVSDIVPAYWQMLKGPEIQHKREFWLLVRCLSSVAGLGALCVRIRMLLDTRRQDNDFKPQVSKSVWREDVRDVLEMLHMILKGKYTGKTLWHGIDRVIANPVQRHLLIKELASMLASGKILSLSAEALSICDLSRVENDELSWLGEGLVYSSWLGENIRHLLTNVTAEDVDICKLGTSLLLKGLSLGYGDRLVEAAFPRLLVGKERVSATELRLFNSLPTFDATRVLAIILRVMSKRLVSTPTLASGSYIGAIAAATEKLVEERPALKAYLIEWLTSTAAGGMGSEIGVRRAILKVLFEPRYSAIIDEAVPDRASKRSHGEQVLWKLLNLFGDKLFIQHSPMLHQESCAQNLLLSAGWMHKINSSMVQELSKSSQYLSAISNRLAAPSERARFLGMVFGMAVSDLVDPPNSKMKFNIDAVNEPEGKWYRSLTHIKEMDAAIEDLRPPRSCGPSPPAKLARNKDFSSDNVASTKIIEIEEITDEETREEHSSDDDLPIYAKPDSDPEDEEEDPTLIQRNKPVAPVYIRDLIIGLRDSENYDRHKLSIANAASLIRRKSNFGSEVSEHIEQLASQITGLKDGYEMENFQEMRIQAMIALVVAQPLKMGQWFSNMLFSGDYSISQRASMLTALTMAARELAGYREDDAKLTGARVANEELFPSKRLPHKLDQTYRVDAAPVNALSQQLERTMIQPMAAEAADQLTGPKVLKVRTFSSRMEFEKKRKRPIRNELAKIVADGFFFPLTNRWRADSQIYGDSSVFKTHFLQAHFLKTIALIISASGTSNLSLPAMTVEFWALLLSRRASALGAKPVLEALMFGLLTVLDLNSNDQQRIAEHHSRELLETRAWTEQVLENLGSGAPEDEKLKLLAAGVLVRAKEVVDKYQSLLIGELIDYI